MKLQPDLLAAKRWIFPLNRPKRDYQFNISRNCLFNNALVALPTGLGKTFIAGVVMLNCELFGRWCSFLSLSLYMQSIDGSLMERLFLLLRQSR